MNSAHDNSIDYPSTRYPLNVLEMRNERPTTIEILLLWLEHRLNLLLLLLNERSRLLKLLLIGDGDAGHKGERKGHGRSQTLNKSLVRSSS